ncbi:MAG: oligopeptide transporter, OPT family [Lachnospiraceae bacterium]|nr:oligopeptide transporter, OPT family [Lachnospiraceae bacterium]
MKEENFKPYIPADKVTPELTALSVILGILLAVIFGAANAYLGLRVGMTVSASIPAAVISMGVLRVILSRNSILESNMVQTIGSAGESLAAGAIFTLPVLYLWAGEGKMDNPSVATITIICLCGGVLGILFMVPLRNALIVKEHGVLPYPEGTACAEVLLAGEEGGSNAATVFIGMGFAAIVKFVIDGLGAVAGTIAAPIKAFKTEVSAEIYPALLGVGYICGPKISSYMFAGGVLGWLVLIPLIVTFGGDTILYPGTDTIAQMYADGGAGAIWGSYVRYIGAGAVAAGGILSLIKSLPLIITTFRDAIKGMRGAGAAGSQRTEKDLDFKVVGLGILALILVLWLVPVVPVSIVGAIIIVVFGFFFATVSSRMVGLVGSSNNPVSGMAIATLLFATMCLKATSSDMTAGMQGAIAIGSIICIIACIAGDTSQDLKTGYILGATPVKQQIGEILGTVVAAVTMSGVLYLLSTAWGYGSTELPAPQATLMKMIVEGVMDGNLPWALIFAGAFIAVIIEILGISVLPVAIGLYLPLELSAGIMVGGLIRLYADKKKEASEESRKVKVNNGILFSSGMIAGEGLVGVLLAIFAVFGVKTDISGVFSTGMIGGIVVLVLLVLAILKFSVFSKEK